MYENSKGEIDKLNSRWTELELLIVHRKHPDLFLSFLFLSKQKLSLKHGVTFKFQGFMSIFIKAVTISWLTIMQFYKDDVCTSMILKYENNNEIFKFSFQFFKKTV